jgi:hypothetical protein
MCSVVHGRPSLGRRGAGASDMRGPSRTRRCRGRFLAEKSLHQVEHGPHRAPGDRARAEQRSTTLYIALAWMLTGRRFARSGRSVSATACPTPRPNIRCRTACWSASLPGRCVRALRVRHPHLPGHVTHSVPEPVPRLRGDPFGERGIPLGAARPGTTAPSRPHPHGLDHWSCRTTTPAAPAHPPTCGRSASTRRTRPTGPDPSVSPVRLRDRARHQQRQGQPRPHLQLPINTKLVGSQQRNFDAIDDLYKLGAIRSATISCRRAPRLT